MPVPSQQGRQLVAERLAAAGGHQHQRVAAGHDLLDDLRLLAAEAVVTEDVLELFEGRRKACRQGSKPPMPQSDFPLATIGMRPIRAEIGLCRDAPLRSRRHGDGCPTEEFR